MVRSVEMQLIKNQVRCEPGKNLIKNTRINAEFYTVPTDIKSLTREELETQFKAWHEPVYRVPQLLDWLYARRVTTWDAMTNLPKDLREKLRAHFSLQTL